MELADPGLSINTRIHLTIKASSNSDGFSLLSADAIRPGV